MRRPDSNGRATLSRRARRLLVGSGVSATALLVAGCSSEDLPRLGFPDSATKQGHLTINMWQGSWIAALIVGGIVWGLIGYAVIFFRRRPNHAGTLPTQTRYNLPVEILYSIVPLIVVSVLFYFTWRDQNELLELDPNPDLTVHVVGQRWSWTFNYVDQDVYIAGTPDAPPTLVLPQGENVQFDLTTADVIHSFWIPAFLFKMDLMPHSPNIVQMTPEKLGTFSGKCAELCGDDHSRMLFAVQIVPPDQFDDFINGLEAKGQTGQIRPDLRDQAPGKSPAPASEEDE